MYVIQNFHSTTYFFIQYKYLPYYLEIRLLWQPITTFQPCIISVEEVFDTPDTVYIILELMQGGELFERILQHGKLSELVTRFYFRQMVLAVRYLHSEGITHRDLKVILFSTYY